MRGFVGLLGFASGAGLLVLGISSMNAIYLVSGSLALVIGLLASFRHIVCPSCKARMWASTRKLTHCMQCGAELTESG